MRKHLKAFYVGDELSRYSECFGVWQISGKKFGMIQHCIIDNKDSLGYYYIVSCAINSRSKIMRYYCSTFDEAYKKLIEKLKLT